jgi:hypothetical protein
METAGQIFKNNLDKATSGIPVSSQIMTDINKIKSDMKETEKIKGGLSDNKSLEDISKKHEVKLAHIENQFQMGIKKEKEHTKDEKEVEEIAKDHLWEDPNYYTKLNKMEASESDKSYEKSAKRQFTKDLQDDPDFMEFKKNAKYNIGSRELTFGTPNVTTDDTYVKKRKYGRVGKEESKEATGSGSVGAYSSPLFGGDDEFIEKSNSETPKKVEAKEATGSGSVGAYESPAAWAKSTGKKDWRGKSKTQIPGGAFVSVKKKCSKFPYCNKGDINALHIYKNESVAEAIKNVAEKTNLSENIIKAIIEYEYEKNIKSNK